MFRTVEDGHCQLKSDTVGVDCYFYVDVRSSVTVC